MKKLIFLIFFSISVSQDILPDSVLSDEPFKEPFTALFLSAAIPGAGQIYTENYFKSALFMGGFATVVALVLRHQEDIDQTKRLVKKPLSSNIYYSLDDKKKYIFNENKYRRDIDRYYDRRNEVLWQILGVYVANLIDAYVGAYLYKFDEIMLKPRINFSSSTDNYQLHLTIRF
jgi:hypothetical protein